MTNAVMTNAGTLNDLFDAAWSVYEEARAAAESVCDAEIDAAWDAYKGMVAAARAYYDAETAPAIEDEEEIDD